MKKIIIILSILSTNVVFSQSISSTFQGQIAGGAPFFLHIEATGGTLTGFYKYQSDSFVVPLKGTIDAEGNFMLTDNKKTYPAFTGTLQNRLVKGTFRASKKANPQPFYAVNLRGEYLCSHGHFSLVFSDTGYTMMGDWNITTHRQDDGSIYLLCDSLNTKLFVRDSTLVLDTEYGQPSFLHRKIDRESELIFTLSEGFLDGMSRIEFPEKFEDDEGFFSIKEIKLNDRYSVRLRQVRQSEYIIRKWQSEHLRHEPYKVITDLKEAQKMLGKKMKIVERQEEEWKFIETEITFMDGMKKRLDQEYEFVAFFPEVNILLFAGGHGSDRFH